MARCILQVAFVLIAACFPLGGILAAPTGAGELELIILHNNDMHARFEQTSVSSSKCTPEDAASNKCYGGFARTAHEIRKFREEANKTGGTPVLYLNAGDTYTGTPWFTIFRDNITAAFLNVLKPDAISLGNHEFDEGVEGLVPFLEKAEFPVLAANLDLRQTPELATQKTLKNSTVFTINGVKIGVIGYLTPETKNLTIPNKVTFLPEIASINKEADQLTKDGIHIIIALGHSGYEADQEIAKNCPHVDIVIGGHTNTFLYNGKPPSIETPAGPYPKVIAQKSGKKVPVVQAYAYTKYLGKLHVKFDKNGHLIEWNGEPILLNGTVPQDSDVLQLLEVYRPAIAEIESSIVGQTKVQLQGGAEHCRRGECNLGNLIADSMVHARFMEHKENIQGAWTDAAIAFIQGGGIRTSIDKKKDGSITRNDILSVLPFRNKLYVAETTGDLLKKALERSASKLDDGNSNGGFLQMSGIHTVFDHDNPVGKRVISVKALCAACEVPRYYDVEADKKYKIILPEFLLIGGDGFNWTSSSDPLANSILMKAGDGQALIDYLQAKGPVYPAVEWRLTIKNLKEPPSKGGSGRNSVSLVLLAGALLLRNLY